MQTTQCWHFSFLGGIEATSANFHLNDLMGKKAGAVLALLALSPGRTRPREEIINQVWPEVEYEEAQERFRQQLSRLRKLLEPKGVAPGSVLVTNRSQAGIATGHQSDVGLFQDRLRRAAMATDPTLRAQYLREALALYKGEFAPGFYLDFLLTERERLATLAQEAQARLAALEANPAVTTARAEPVAPPVSAVKPRTVPTQNTFFGRKPERERIGQLLQECHLVTVLGPGGTGKTRLMQELMADYPQAHLIYLSAVTNGTAIADAIVTALDLPASTDTALARLQSALADKEPLLILDNVEQLVATGGPEAIAELLETLPALRFLVTSRIKLDLPQECVFTLTPLPQNNAVALFIDRARYARAYFTPTPEDAATIAELCRRLDGLPLAIELAASRAAILTPVQILQRLNRRFDLLSDKRRDREERHTSLRAALDWGWGLLPPDVQRFFVRLCVFRGSFSLEATEVVTGEYLSVEYLQTLADASFLIVENAEGRQRFRLLETLREYGQEKWEAGDVDTLPQRHATYFLAQAREWSKQLEGENFTAAMTSFKQDRDNFTAALDASLVSDPVQALELCRQLADFWEYAYLKREALNYLTATLMAVQKGNNGNTLNNHQWAFLHGGLAYAHQNFHEHSRAHQHFQECLSHHDKQIRATAGDEEEHRLARRYRAGALHNFANHLFYQHRYEDALQHYTEAATLNRAMDNKAWVANNLNGLCNICCRQAFQAKTTAERAAIFEQGLIYANEAVEICRALRQDYFLCYMLLVQGDTLLGLERYIEALPITAEGFALAASLENWRVASSFLVHYHHLGFRNQDWSLAAQCLGAIEGLGERFNIVDATEEDISHLSITDARRAELRDILGKEGYTALHEQGFQAGRQLELDTLKQWVSSFRQWSTSPLDTTRPNDQGRLYGCSYFTASTATI